MKITLHWIHILDTMSNICFDMVASEAVSTLHQRSILKQMTAPVDLIASDVLDHYRSVVIFLSYFKPFALLPIR